jgi:hypothetical protein
MEGILVKRLWRSVRCTSDRRIEGGGGDGGERSGDSG